MSHCAECGAPLLAGHVDCWSCRRPVAAAPRFPSPSPAGVAPASTISTAVDPGAIAAAYRTCAQCGLSSPRYKPACTGCGQLFGPDLLPFRETLPTGWTLTDEPDGSVTLAPTIWRRIFFTGAAPPGWLAIVFVLSGAALLLGSRHSPGWWLVDDLLSAFAFLVMGGVLLAATCRKQRWRLGSNLLETRYTLLGRTWGRTHRNATFRLERGFAGDLMSRSGRVYELVVRSDAGREVLMVGSYRFRSDLQNVAAFLAGVTGWPLEDRSILAGGWGWMR